MNLHVAFIIFNRPDTTEKVFNEIAKAKTRKLFVIADGPRSDHPDDIEQCAASRANIDRVDWECEVLKNYSDVNLGCGLRPATGISWVFKQVDKAIILEDDCLPNPTFFRFCEELLEKYNNDEWIMQICGMNTQFEDKNISYSYYFSRITMTWGWATWSRAWQYYDMDIKLWPELCKTSWLLNILEDYQAVEFFKKIFDAAYINSSKVDYWDYQWSFTFWAQNGLSIMPNNNLISNIGFREDATHTHNTNSRWANIPIKEIIFPLKHPPFIVRNNEADQFYISQQNFIKKRPNLYNRLRRKFISPIKAKVFKLIHNQ